MRTRKFAFNITDLKLKTVLDLGHLPETSRFLSAQMTVLSHFKFLYYLEVITVLENALIKEDIHESMRNLWS